MYSDPVYWVRDMYKCVWVLCADFISFFKYPMKMKSFSLTETKLFHFYRIFKKRGTGRGF